MVVAEVYPEQTQRELFLRLGLFNLCFLGAFLVFFLGVAVSTYFRAERFQNEGIDVVATIAARDVELGLSRPNGGGQTEYLFLMVYTTKEGEELRVLRDVGSVFYDAHHVGDEVTIRYLTDDPETFEYNLGSSRQAIGWFLAICLGLAGGMSYLAWRVYRLTKMAVLARRDGVAETVEVTGFVESTYKAGWKDGYHMTWVDAAGVVGRSLKRPEDGYGRIAPGDRITIFRSADGDWWEGDVGSR